MKHQYFGDINDYKKYSLLRCIASTGRLKILVCWMLTEDDSGSDGNHIKYFSNETYWKKYDPDLFDFLRKSVLHNTKRSVRLIEQSGLLPSTVYHRSVLTDTNREVYFQKNQKLLDDTDLIFFDPDNGIEVRSVKKHSTGSHKYIFWDEIQTAYEQHHSLLIYQHFPRVNRKDYCLKRSEEIFRHTSANNIYIFHTTRVAFFCLAQPGHEKALTAAASEIKQQWENEIRIFSIRSSTHPTQLHELTT